MSSLMSTEGESNSISTPGFARTVPKGTEIDSMSHRVHDVVDPNPDAQRRESFGIIGVVGVFPRIPQIHVEADRHHQAALVVVDSAPVRHVSVILPRLPATDPLRARNLVAAVQI